MYYLMIGLIFFSARIMSRDFLSQNSGNAAFAKWNVFGSDVFNSIFAQLPILREDLTRSQSSCISK